MKSVRQQIIDHLKIRGKVSATELSKALHVTPANIRHHLGILLNEGAIQVAGTLPPLSRGRPAKMYALTHLVDQHNLDGLASALLEELMVSISEPDREAAFQRIAARLKPVQEIPPVNLTQRLTRAVQWLNDRHYAAHWEAHSEAPRVTLGNCPYASILADHPELCHLDAALLSDLLAAPARQTAKLARDSRGSTFCRFMIGLRK
jgi:predicted ArsR family transcriptional regulator